MLKEVLVIGTIILFFGVAVQPSIATIQPEKEIDFEPKDYLFQTIVDIGNNQELKDIFEQIENEIIYINFDFRDIFQKLLIRTPGTISSLFFKRPELSTDYLNLVYNNGCKIVDNIGEEDSFKMVEAIKFSNPELVEKINDVIDNNYELNSRFSTLAEMNNNLKIDSPFFKHPIICATLILIFVSSIIAFKFYQLLLGVLSIFFPIIMEALWFYSLLFYELILFILVILFLSFECIDWYWYPY